MPPASVEVLPSPAFLVDNRFQFNQRTDENVQIGFMGHRFIEFFSFMYSGSHYSTLVSEDFEYSFDERQFVDRHGGELRTTVTLGEIWFLLSRQGHGEPGALLVDGQLNLFFVHDRQRFFRIVLLEWAHGGWRIDASFYPVGRIARSLRVFAPQY